MSRNIILNKIKNSKCEKVELINFDTKLTIYKDKIEVFKRNLEKAGGKIFEVKKDNISKKIEEIFGSSKKIVSYIKDCKAKNIDEERFKSPKDLKNIEVAILKAEFGVCENGALWCDDKDVKYRSIYFICENIVIILKKDKILNNMHEAYKKIDFNKNNFGIFISGPSKTADIEQSLVIGAHGAIKSYVFLLD